MQPIEPPDVFHLNAAIGWLGLGNRQEAGVELEKINPDLRAHPDVLELRWQLCAAEQDWAACLELAEALVQAAPDRPFGWIHRAYALRRAPGGGLQAAWDALLPAAKQFPKQPLIPYNLACYACQMGNLKETRRWLAKAFAIGDAKQLKRMALDDPDLQPFWAQLGKV